MLEHRFQELFANPSVDEAYVAWPLATSATACPGMATPCTVQDVYRLAAERTRQLHQPPITQRLQFSVN